jgi:hypothetical protein
VVVRHMFGVVKRAVEDGERSDIRSHSNIFPECRSARLGCTCRVNQFTAASSKAT